MNKYDRHFLCLISVAAAIAAFLLANEADNGELSGGILTGSFIWMAFLSVGFFAGSAIAFFASHKIAGPLRCFGALFAIPLASWLLLPGLWCYLFPCSTEYPVFVFHRQSLMLILLVAVSYGKTYRMRAQ